MKRETTFDIYQLDKLGESADPWVALDGYINALLKRFAKSPEGLARLQEDPDMGFWASQLIRLGYDHIGVTLPEMTTGDVEELLSELFPAKISLIAPEEADTALPELIAFWEFLKREFELTHAEAILKYLRRIKPVNFRKWMNDSSRFGMAKSFFMQGRAAGYDMSNEKEAQAFIEHYNASLIEREDFGELSPLDRVSGRKKEDAQAKRLRKIGKASKRKNRKRGR